MNKYAVVFRLVLLTLLSVLLVACASAPKVDNAGIDTSITPSRVVVEGEALKGMPVVWGGIIIAASNQQDHTQLELLAYPLNRQQKPDINKAPLGRFLARQAGYLETGDYHEGRLLTLRGELAENHVGQIGQSTYTYPVVNMREHYLWPEVGNRTDTRFHFGIGVMIRN